MEGNKTSNEQFRKLMSRKLEVSQEIQNKTQKIQNEMDFEQNLAKFIYFCMNCKRLGIKIDVSNKQNGKVNKPKNLKKKKKR